MTLQTRVVDSLCRVLRKGDDAHRCFASQALGAIGGAGAVEALIERLVDEDEDVRIDAVEALGRLGDRRAGDPLLQSLVEDPCGDVKVTAVRALGHLGATAAIAPLRRLARERHDSVAWDETEFLSDGWDDWLDIQVKAIEALGNLGAEEAVPDIVAAMSDEMGQDLGDIGIRALARLGDPGIRALADFLEAGDERLRRRIAWLLSEIASDTARDILRRVLRDPSADVRLAAVHGLAAADPGDPALAAAFDDPHPAVRAAMVGLCVHCHPERIDALLDDPSDEVQIATLESLAAAPALPRPEKLDFRMRVKLRGPSEAVAVTACQTVARLAPAIALDDLSEQLLDRTCPVELRRTAAAALGEIGSSESVEVLRSAVGDENRHVRAQAIAAIAQVAKSRNRPGASLETLLQALAGQLVPLPDGEEQEAAPEPLPEPEPESVADTESEAEEPWPKSTLEALTGESAEAQSAPGGGTPVELATEDLEFLALTRQGPRKKRVSLESKVPVHEDVRRFTARVLGDVPCPEVARALAETLSEDDLELRRTAADSLARLAERLGRLPAEAGKALLLALGDADRDLRLAATRALGGTDREAVGPLIERLDDDDSFVRAEAARALARLKAVSPEVAELLSDAHAGVRLAAAEALAAAGEPGATDLLVNLAFSHEGMQRREAARLLRQLDREAASERFLETLDDPGAERYWRVAIDALVELYQPGPELSERMVA